MFGGTSAAAPFVTGTFALLLSEFGHTSVPALKLAVLRNARGRRGSVIPPLLDAWSAYGALKERM
jgi:subtilisin family serine protease